MNLQNKPPTIKTDHLILRPYVPGDAASIKHNVSQMDIAATTINLPHPYPDGAAEDWIKTQAEDFKKGTQVQFAIVLASDDQFIGGIGLKIEPRHLRGELGYWIRKAYWKNGYCTEAAKAMLKYGFLTHGLNRIHATFMNHNLASGRVLQKIGMKREGLLRQYYERFGSFRDMEMYSILSNEYHAD